MARKLRVEYAGARYHVTARGNDRRAIFQSDADRRHWLELLAEGQRRYEVRVFAWVLMSNHVHLVVQTQHPNLNRFMHYLNTAYTVWANKRNRRTGHLFEGPYKGIVMEEDGYLLTASGYVHMNPVRVKGGRDRPVAERLRQVGRYAWSSYRAYAGGRRTEGKDVVIDCDRMWGQLGARSQAQGRKMYREYILGWLQQEAEERAKPPRRRDAAVLDPFSQVRHGCLLGSDEFRDFVQGLLGRETRLSLDVVGYKAWRAQRPLEEVLRVICEERGIELEAARRRGRNHWVRDLTMYLCRETAEKTLKEIGAAFGIGTAAAGHAIARAKRRLRTDQRLAQNVAASIRAINSKLET